MKSLVVAILIALSLAALANAQTFRGTILGTVTDSTGLPVVGANVTVKNVETGLERAVTSAEDGSYAAPELPIGTYDVTVEKAGFQASVIKGVVVEVAHDQRVDATLKPGQLATSVEVSAESLTQVETTNDNLGGSFVSQELKEMPINGRDYTKLLLMVPGATGDPSGELDSPGSFGQFSTNGNRGRSNNFLLDGTDMNDGYRNIPAINQGGVFAIPSTILPVDSIAELQVLANSEAEYGRSSGSVVNIVTKSGTNAIHGAAFEYFRNDHLNARNFFNTVGPKDAFRNNQFGGSVGGPFIKDKTFWYFAYEGQREGFGLTSVNTVPTLHSASSAATSANDYFQAVSSISGSNPAACTTDVFTCVTTQPNGVINPVIVNLYNLCHTKGGCSGGNLPWPVANFGGAAPVSNNVSSDRAKNDLNSVIAKVDHQFSSTETLTGRYFYGESFQSVPLGAAGGNNIPNTNTDVPTDVHLVSISLVSVLSGGGLNEARFGYNRFHEDFLAEDRSVFGNPSTSIGLNTGLGSVTGNVDPRNFGLPQMTFNNGLSSLGSSRFSNPRRRVDRNFHFLDNFSWKHSRHDIKFGYEFRYTSIDTLEDINFRGRLKFADLAGFLQGNVTGGAINYGDTTRNTLQASHAFYVQDSLRVSSRLTANLGLRWDYYGVIHEANNHFSSYNPASGLFEQSSPYDKDLNNFAPRVSLAYDLNGNGRTVIRSGFGVFYDSFSHDFFTGQLYENSNNLGPAYNAIGSKPIFQGLTVGTLFPSGGGAVFDTSPVSLGNDTGDASTISKLRTPYIYNYSLNVQHQLLPNTVLQVGYVGTAGRKLQRIRDINQPSLADITASDIACAGGANISLTTCLVKGSLPPVQRNFNSSGSATVLPGQNNNAAIMSALAPSAPFYLQQIETSSRSSYNSLQASLAMRNWHGLTQQASYNWSHSIDDASDGQDYVPHAGQPNDSANPFHSNRGNSNFDTRHHFVWTLTYGFPKWETLGRMGEGWTASSVVSIISGHPFEVSETADDYDGSDEFFGRPDLVSKPVYNYSDPTHFLDLTAFAVPCTLDGNGTGAANCRSGTRHFGTLGRNALLGPAFRQWDLSIVKETRLNERVKLEVHAELFNVLNHVNFANPLWPSFFDDIGPFSIDATGATKGRLSSSQFFPILATADTGPGNPILGGGGPRSAQFAVKFTF